MSLPEKMTVCPKCNCEIPGDSVFCPGCRAKLCSATVSNQSYEKLKQMFSNVDKWELMGIRRVVDRSALQMTDQQRQEELDNRIQSAQDVAIANRIAMTEVERKRKKPITIVFLSILAMIVTALTVYWMIRCFGY